MSERPSRASLSDPDRDPDPDPDPGADAAVLALAQGALRAGTPGHYDEWRGAAVAEAAPAPLAVAAADAVPGAAPGAAPVAAPGAVPNVATNVVPGATPQAVPSGGPSAAAVPAIATARWQAFFRSLGERGWSDLGTRLRGVQQRVRDDGASYNVYDEKGQRPWPLELLPLILEPGEWAVIEHGVQQRARMLQAALHDLYGPQTLLRDALLPASLVFAHPDYLRPMHGLAPVGGAHLHILAFDLARAPSGGFHVLAQRVQAPSGLGYLLENRIVISNHLSEPFKALRVQRVAASFRHLLEGLVRSRPADERSRIVLLTPGPHNETYFEQVFLARYLGVALVEGSDLTVRANRVYLKTLHGLERVHVVLRRVDDAWLDPLELRADSALGVPGLLQAMRAGEVVVANAPGVGFLESPGLTAFWPGVADRLLDEDLLLPASTSWWCGEAAVWARQRTRLADYVVAPTFPDSAEGSGFRPIVAGRLTSDQREALARRIDAEPADYTLQARVRPAETPVWVDGQLQPRAAVMRVFALADGQGGWHVLPGGLTRVAGDSGQIDPWLSMQHGSASVDTWVVARGAVDTTTLLPKPLTVADLQGQRRTVTSRSAENLFWLGRYVERAEHSVRLARLALDALHNASQPVARLIDALARHHGLVGEKVPPLLKSPRLFERALVHQLDPRHEAAQRQGVAHDLRSLRSCAQALRERLSPKHWRLIHEVSDHFEQHIADALARGEGHASTPDVMGVLTRAAVHLTAITGAQTDRMTRDDGWRLLSVGRQIERLDSLCHVLSTGFAFGAHEQDDGFALMLGLFDSVITYRAQYQGRREVLPLLHLLVFDTDNPRSLAWVARTMRDRLRKLATHDPGWADAVTSGLPAPQEWDLAQLAQADANGNHALLLHHLNTCASGARALSDAIDRHLFVHVISSDRPVWQ